MPEQLSLPYEEIGAVASRDALRTMFKEKSYKTYLIPFNQIKVRENFNRIVFLDIPELAGLIAEHGQSEPFVVDVTKDGKVKLEQGERRYKARLLNIEKGLMKPDELVECIVNPKETTEQERYENIWITNMGRQNLHPLDQATFMHRQKYLFSDKPVSNEELAIKWNVSRQTIDNLMIVADMNDGLKHDIKAGTITVTDALKLVRNENKLKKQTDAEEDKSHITDASAPSLPQDPLKDELKELADIELEHERYLQQQAEKDRKEQDRLERDAVLVSVTVDEMAKHIGKRLAAHAMLVESKDFVDDETGETLTVKNEELILKQGTEITEPVIEELLHKKVESVYIYKEIRAVESVITEPVAGKEKYIYDESRPEVAAIQNAIKLSDRILTQIEKSDLSEGLKKDMTDWSTWQMNSMLEAREYIHKTKKQNKIR